MTKKSFCKEDEHDQCKTGGKKTRATATIRRDADHWCAFPTLQCVSVHMDRLLALPSTAREAYKIAIPYMYTCWDPAPVLQGHGSFNTIAGTVEMDTFEAGEALIRAGWLNPVVLNMANEIKCGGAWSYSRGSQEEDLMRRSSLPLSLWPHRLPADTRLAEYESQLPRKSSLYPFSKAGVVYSPHVLVCRNECGELIPRRQRYHVAVISAAAQDLRNWTGHYDGPFDFALTCQKLRSILWAAWHNGHTALVLGAFGCGAFQNNPNRIASIIKLLVDEDGEFAGIFEVVLIAIIKSQSNLDAFSHAFPLMNTMQQEGDGGHKLYHTRNSDP